MISNKTHDDRTKFITVCADHTVPTLDSKERKSSSIEPRAICSSIFKNTFYKFPKFVLVQGESSSPSPMQVSHLKHGHYLKHIQDINLCGYMKYIHSAILTSG